MSGKYPLIEDTAKTRSRVTLSPGVTNPLSTSDYGTLSKIFPNSPIYVETNDTYRVIAKEALSPDLQTGDGDQFPDPVDLNFGKAPALPVDQADFEGAYYPNLIANPDPAGGEGTSAGSTVVPNDNFGTGATAGSNKGPATSASMISETDTISAPSVGTTLGQSAAQPEFPGALAS